MGSHAKLALLAALLAALAVFLTRDRVQDAAAVAPLAREPAARGDEAASLVRTAPERARASMSAAMSEEAAQPEAAPNLGPPATLALRVTDLDGRPLRGIELLIGPLDQPLNTVGRSDEVGQLDVAWRPGSGPPDVAVALRSGGDLLGGLWRLTLPPGAREELRIALDPTLARQLRASRRIVSGTSFVIAGNASTLSFEGETLRVAVAESATEGTRRRPGPLVVPVERDEDGVARFVAAPPPAASGAREVQSFASGRVSFTLAGGLQLEALVAGEPLFVIGAATDIAGRPAAGLHVAAHPRGDGDAPSVSTTTGADGAFDLRLTRPGRYELRAGAPGARGATEEIVLDEGETFTWSPVVDRGLALVGDVRYADDDAACARALVEASAPVPGGTWRAIVRADEEGHFVVPHCPTTLVRVDIVPDGSPHGIPRFRAAAVAPGGEPWRGVVDREDFGLVALRPDDDEPGQAAAAELRAWRVGDPRGVLVPLVGPCERAVTFELPAGLWSLALGHQGLGWRDSLDVDVRRALPPEGTPEGAGELGMAVLGRVALGATGRMTLEPPAPEERVAVRALRDGRPPTLVWRGAPGAGVEELPLAPGRYAVERAPVDGGAATLREVEVLAGRTTRVEH